MFNAAAALFDSHLESFPAKKKQDIQEMKIWYQGLCDIKMVSHYYWNLKHKKSAEKIISRNMARMKRPKKIEEWGSLYTSFPMRAEAAKSSCLFLDNTNSSNLR